MPSETVPMNRPFLTMEPQPLTITKIEPMTSDSSLFTFEYGDKAMPQPLGIPIFHHLVFLIPTSELAESEVVDEWNGEPDADAKFIKRKFTPTNIDAPTGTCQIPIKMYLPTSEFPDGGRGGRWWAERKVGDKCMAVGPVGKYTYQMGGGWHSIDPLNESAFPGDAFRHDIDIFNAVVGGSGATPLVQLLKSFVADQSECALKQKVRCVVANHSDKDIMCKADLDAIAKDSRVEVHYIVDKAGDDWTGSKGRINEEVLKKAFLQPTKNSIFYACGPMGLRNAAKDIMDQWGQDDALTLGLKKKNGH